MMDPEFSPGSEHVAHCPVANPTTKQWAYDAELYLVKDDTKYASSGTVSFTLAAGASDTIDFPIVMPSATGTYKVYLDVYVAGELIAAYQATEDITLHPEPGPADIALSIIDADTGAHLSSIVYITHEDGSTYEAPGIPSFTSPGTITGFTTGSITISAWVIKLGWNYGLPVELWGPYTGDHALLEGTNEITIELTKVSPGTLKGRTVNELDEVVFGPKVELTYVGIPELTMSTWGAQGGYFSMVAVVFPGTHILKITKEGYETYEGAVTIGAGLITDVGNILLTRIG